MHILIIIFQKVFNKSKISLCFWVVTPHDILQEKYQFFVVVLNEKQLLSYGLLFFYVLLKYFPQEITLKEYAKLLDWILFSRVSLF